MKKKNFILLFLVLQLSTVLIGQDLYFISIDINDPTYNFELGISNPLACEDSLILDAHSIYFTDITFDPSGDLYGFTPIGNSPAFSNTIQNINYDPIFFTYIFEQLSDEVTGLTCTPTGSIYATGKGLTAWKTDGITTNNYLGDFPNSMQAQGDITFREGKLYQSSISNSLIEVDINNPSNSMVVFDFPLGSPEIHGLATVEIDCDSFITYASGITATGSTIYIVDFDNETLIEVCQTDRFIVGFASKDECLVPICEVTLDLDGDNNSGASNNNFEIGKICALPINISDEDVIINSELDHIDSIQIRIVNSNYVNEYFDLVSANNISVVGGGTKNLILINNGLASLLDFENAISDILYYNDASIFLSTPVDIEVIAFSFNAESTPAYSAILLGESDVSLNILVDSISCFGDNDGGLEATPFGGVEPYTFLWNNDLDTNSLSELSAGIYEITVTDKYGCSVIEDNIILVHPDSLKVIVTNIGELTICDNVGELLSEGDGGTGSYEFLWSNGTFIAVNNEINAGTYSVTLTDQNGCEAMDSITIDEGNSVFSNELIFLCEGDVFEINYQEYSSDTIVCEVLILANGCDSTHCYEVEFLENVTSIINEKICPGDSFMWNGEILTRDTILTNVYSSSNGCDSIVSFNLELYNLTPIDFITSGSLCDGGQVEISTNLYNSYLWSTGETTSVIEVGEENIFGVTVTDNNNCELVSEVEIRIEDLNVDYIVTPSSCYGEKDAIIQIDNIEGGTAPYLFSLDGAPLGQSFSFDNLESGIHDLLVEDINGCQEEIEIIIDHFEEPILEIQNYHEIALGDSLELQLITNISDPGIVWEPAIYLNCDTCLSVVSNPLESVFYEILVTDSNGCVTKNMVEINVDHTLDVFIPNAFSPNDDGINDWFTVYGGASVTNINYLRIFDRWGELVFEEKDFQPNEESKGWDGRFRNRKMLKGVYVYIVEVERVDGSVHSLSGELTLAR